MNNKMNGHCRGCDQSCWIETERGQGYLKCCSDTECSLSKFPMPLLPDPEIVYVTEERRDIVEFKCDYIMEWRDRQTGKYGNDERVFLFEIPKSGVIEGNVFLDRVWFPYDNFSDYEFRVQFTHILLRFVKDENGKIVPEFRFILGEWKGYEDSIFCNNDGTLSDGRIHQNYSYDFENCKRLEVR